MKRVAGAVTFFAEAADMATLHAAARARAEQLQVSRCTLDSIAGLQDGYMAKLLAPTPLRTFGSVSLWPALRALGLKLIVVDDPEALEQIGERLVPKVPGHDRHESCDQAAVNRAAELVRILHAEMGRRSMRRLHGSKNAQERRECARRAANARWAKPRPGCR